MPTDLRRCDVSGKIPDMHTHSFLVSAYDDETTTSRCSCGAVEIQHGGVARVYDPSGNLESETPLPGVQVAQRDAAAAPLEETPADMVD